MHVDDLGAGHGSVTGGRVVCLVPSLTEAIATTCPGTLVGATDWCTHPADLDVVRVRGTKNPDVPTIVSLRPDLVVANTEENREPDVAALRDAGLDVWVTDIRTVPGALASMGRLLAALGAGDVPWLAQAGDVWSTPPPAGATVMVAVPIWRRPWMVLGCDTFAGDVLGRLGYANAFGGSTERYPRTTVEEIVHSGAAGVVLPSEPYAFTATDGPEALQPLPCALVDGRDLTWYGPSLVEARDRLAGALAPLRRPAAGR